MSPVGGEASVAGSAIARVATAVLGVVPYLLGGLFAALGLIGTLIALALR